MMMQSGNGTRRGSCLCVPVTQSNMKYRHMPGSTGQKIRLNQGVICFGSFTAATDIRHITTTGTSLYLHSGPVRAALDLSSSPRSRMSTAARLLMPGCEHHRVQGLAIRRHVSSTKLVWNTGPAMRSWARSRKALEHQLGKT